MNDFRYWLFDDYDNRGSEMLIGKFATMEEVRAAAKAWEAASDPIACYGPDAAGRNMERGLARNLNVGFQKTEYRMETSTCKRNGLRFSYT